MPDRIAVLADIHVVLPALEAVLAEPEVKAADRIVILGDVGAGPSSLSAQDMGVASAKVELDLMHTLVSLSQKRVHIYCAG